jgi:hypothetical protein
MLVSPHLIVAAAVENLRLVLLLQSVDETPAHRD